MLNKLKLLQQARKMNRAEVLQSIKDQHEIQDKMLKKFTQNTVADVAVSGAGTVKFLADNANRTAKQMKEEAGDLSAELLGNDLDSMYQKYQQHDPNKSFQDFADDMRRSGVMEDIHSSVIKEAREQKFTVRNAIKNAFKATGKDREGTAAEGLSWFTKFL